jgi:hypothetical protein
VEESVCCIRVLSYRRSCVNFSAFLEHNIIICRLPFCITEKWPEICTINPSRARTYSKHSCQYLCSSPRSLHPRLMRRNHLASGPTTLARQSTPSARSGVHGAEPREEKIESLESFSSNKLIKPILSLFKRITL